MTLRKLFSIITLLLVATVMWADNEIKGVSDMYKNRLADSIISIKFDVRADATYNQNLEDKTEDFGFRGKYLKFALNGNISDKFSYAFRYRIYKDNGAPSDFFGSVDWVYLAYQINKNFSVSAGKEVIAIGGYEYDKAPIDVYFWSDYWNNIPAAFQFGASFNYHTNDGKHTLKFQATNSPFSGQSLDGLFAYNLIWYGDLGWFKPIYSVNFIEYDKGRFMNYIALGNKFTIGNYSLELDYMNRASFQQENFFADFSIIANMNYLITDHWNVFIKGGYDQNKAQAIGAPYIFDRSVTPGTQYGFYGAGVEFYPIKSLKNNLRIHAYIYSNTKPVTETNQKQVLSFNLGVRWQMRVFQR